jgi:type I site-specific restriction endonuclease
MPRQLSEERTRKDMIDPQLEQAGWYLRDHAKVKIEIPVDGYDAEPWNGVTDYCLYRDNGEVLAVVEAKRTSVDVCQAEAQLTYYVNENEKHQSFRPFGLLSNGFEIYAARDALVEQTKEDGFEKFTLDELRTRLWIYNLDTTKCLCAGTFQTLSNIFKQFSPAFFDLIDFDKDLRSYPSRLRLHRPQVNLSLSCGKYQRFSKTVKPPE